MTVINVQRNKSARAVSFTGLVIEHNQHFDEICAFMYLEKNSDVTPEQAKFRRIKFLAMKGKAATKPENWYRDPGTPVPVSVSVSIETWEPTLKLQRNQNLGTKNPLF